MHLSLRPIPLLAVAAALACAPQAAAQRTPRAVFVPRSAVPLAQTCADALPTPPEMSATSGGSLTMAPLTYQIGGQSFRTNVYNGNYLAPTLRVGLGERMVLTVNNNMEATPTQPADKVKDTNQHFHGLVVTPLPDTGDNVTHVHIPQGRSNRNSFPLLRNFQSEGLMWYHPHPHGITAPQVHGGLAGALVVGNLLERFPQYRGATERIMLVKGTGSVFNPTLNLNGVPCAALTIAPGERQLWRIGNLTADAFVNLKLTGYRFIVLALDGNAVPAPMVEDSLFISPGSRVEAVVVGGTGAWDADLVAAPFPGSGLKAPVKIAELRTVGRQARSLQALRAEDEAQAAAVDQALVDSIRRLVTAPQVDRFTLVYSFGGGARLNGKLYDPRRLDRAVEVGRVQEWTLINATGAPHTFHIHQTDFALIEMNGRRIPLPEQTHHDNVLVGVHDVGGKLVGDTVVIRFKFLPIAAGPFVYHCHVLGHEDAGMMQNICVYDPGNPNANREKCNQWFPVDGTGGGGGDGAAGHGGHGIAHGTPRASHAPGSR